MRDEQASAILAALDGGWHQDGRYAGGRCLGMAISDSIRDEQAARQVMGEVGQQVRALFPHRVQPRQRAGLLLFNCCGSAVVPAFNAHPQTTLDDLRRVVLAAVEPA
jgi:hypothetical protein